MRITVILRVVSGFAVLAILILAVIGLSMNSQQQAAVNLDRITKQVFPSQQSINLVRVHLLNSNKFLMQHAIQDSLEGIEVYRQRIEASSKSLRAELDSLAELARVRAVRLRERLAEADLLITGEGRLDATTKQGKAPCAAARVAHAVGVPAVWAVGGRDEGAVPPLDGHVEIAAPAQAPAVAADLRAAGERLMAAAPSR